MRILITVLFLLCFTSIPSLAKDEVMVEGKTIEGKITAYADGLIQVRNNGVQQSIHRSKNSEFFGDYIIYKATPIKGGVVETYCRIVFIDRFKVIYTTPRTRVEVPKYRVKNIVLNAN